MVCRGVRVDGIEQVAGAKETDEALETIPTGRGQV